MAGKRGGANSNKSSTKRHKKQTEHVVQAIQIKPPCSKSYPKLAYTCMFDNCNWGTRIVTLDGFKSHLSTHNPNRKTYPCDRCGASYFRPRDIRKHYAVKHAIASMCVCERSMCPGTCDLALQRAHLGTNMSNQSAYAPLKCTDCALTFDDRSLYNRHFQCKWHLPVNLQSDLYSVIKSLCNEHGFVGKPEHALTPTISNDPNYRPDFILRKDQTTILLEVDGAQHRGNDPFAEQQRMIRIMLAAKSEDRYTPSIVFDLTLIHLPLTASMLLYHH